MAAYWAHRIWTSLLVVCIPGAVGALVYALFFHGRPVAAELAVPYLILVAAGRARAAERERRERPLREQRVRSQVERVRSSLPAEPSAAVTFSSGSPARLSELIDR